MTTQPPILSLRGIQKSYGPIKVLHGVDLDVRAGEVVALLGENGAGKSTLSNIISGTVQPTSGEMTWLGAPYAPASPRAAMDAGVGMIHQELKLLPKLSIAENVFVGRYLMKGGRIDRATMEERAHAGLQRLGLEIPPGRRVEGLSTANQQLIEIAKALTLNARLLILDEPTAALGGEETQLLFRQIERLKSEGVGIIYISHRLEEIRQIADRIVVMRDGHILQTGTPMEIYDHPKDVFTARLIGTPSMNILPATETNGQFAPDVNGAALIGIRPQELHVTTAGPAAFAATGTVMVVETLGPETLVHFRPSGTTKSLIATAASHDIPTVGTTITAQAAPGSLHLFDPQTEASLGRR